MLHMEIKISVVVPVFNVELYLKKCIESIIKQTFKNFEIILVDDGSTDGCSLICDEYEQKYSFIKAYHKENGGLSDARNFGVCHSSCPYVAFVDSDDIVVENYLEILYKGLLDKEADLSVALYKQVYENTIYKNNSCAQYGNIEIYSGRELLQDAFLGKKGSLSAVAKLYKREMLLKFPFPKGKLYEDMEVLYDIYTNTKKVAFINTVIYYYLQRNNSIVHSHITKQHLYGLKSCICMLNKENSVYNQLGKYIECRLINQACGHLPNLVDNGDKQMFIKISIIIKPYVFKVLKSRIAPIKLKIKAVTYLMNANIALYYARLFLVGKSVICKIRYGHLEKYFSSKYI